MFKSFNSLFILAISATLSISTSCKKEGCTDPTATNYSSEADTDDGSCEYPTININNTGNNTNTVTEELSASVDGNAFSASYVSGVQQNGKYGVSGSNNGVGISLQLSDSNSSGSLGPFSANYVINNTQETANSGSYSYTVTNNVLTGTFSFVTDSYTITNGEFTIEL